MRHERWVKRPKNKKFLRLQIGDEVTWFCRRWVVYSQDETGYKDCYVGKDQADAEAWFNQLVKSLYKVRD